MDYENKFYDKFKNSGFLFKEAIRDKNKKRTFIIITCEKCGNDKIKDQYDLFEKDKICCCFCEDRKKSNRLNIDNEIKEIENMYNVKIINTEKKKNGDILIFFKCKTCHKISKHSLYSLTRNKINIKSPFNCVECSNSKRKWINQHTTEYVKNWLIERNLEPLFTDYKNCYTKIDVRCKCGNTFQISFKNRLNHNDDWIPMCSDCIKKNRLKNYNYSYNRYDTRKKDGVWSKMIKNKFNNTCIISGDKNNIVSHHLNGYNSYPEQKYDINNGVVITNDLHIEFHNKYDKYKGDCTYEQFEEFYENKTGKKLTIKNEN